MAFEELKERHAAMWGSGPFERIAHTLRDMHEQLVTAADGAPGDLWLDLGCGTGELAFLAAETGATVRGADLSPALIETARRQAADGGHDVSFEVADCERQPYDDATFDIVTSSVGIIFAPDHAQVARELARVVRTDGTLAFSAWTAEGEIGEFFSIIARYAPPPVEGAGASITWGSADYCRERLADAFDLEIAVRNSPWEHDSAEGMWQEMSEAFGPIVTLLRALPPERAEAFRSEVVDLFGRMSTGDGVRVDRPYLLVTGRRLG